MFQSEFIISQMQTEYQTEDKTVYGLKWFSWVAELMRYTF